MSDTRSDIVSVVERTRSVAAGGAVVAVHFLRRTAVFVLSEEALVFAEPDGETRRMAITAALSWRRLPMASALSAAAMTAR